MRRRLRRFRLSVRAIPQKKDSEGRGASNGMPHYVRCTSPWPPTPCRLRGVRRWNQKQSRRALRAAISRTKRSDVGMVAFGVGFTQVAYCSTLVSIAGFSMLQKQ